MRKVSASRGGKEGNNAFASDAGHYNSAYMNINQMVEAVLKNPAVKQETIEWLMLNFPNFENSVADYIYKAVYVRLSCRSGSS